MTLNFIPPTDKPAPELPRPTVPAPPPWRWTASGKPGGRALARFHIYVEDCNGRKIAAVWGKDGEREATANLLVAAPIMKAALLDIGDLADKTLAGELIINPIALRDIIFRCAAALAMLDDDQGGAP
jgi:hypothetical protein